MPTHNCKVCGNPIHPERISALGPRVLTCSKECSKDNNRRIQREYQRRRYAQQKAGNHVSDAI